MSERQIISLSRKLNVIVGVMTILTLANVGTLIRDHFTLEDLVKTVSLDHPRVEEMWWTTRHSPRAADPVPELPTKVGMAEEILCLSSENQKLKL